MDFLLLDSILKRSWVKVIKFDGGEGELSDAAVILDWLQNNNPNAKECWVAGFSFGAWIAMQLLMRRPEINYFISITNSSIFKDFFGFLAPCPSSGILIHGDKDEIASHDTTKLLSEKLQNKKIKIDFKSIKGADHFYINHMNNLKVYC